MSDDFDFLGDDSTVVTADTKAVIEKPVEDVQDIIKSAEPVVASEIANNDIPKDPTPVLANNFDEDIPQLIGDDCPAEYVALVEMFQYQYAGLPKLDYKKIYKELPELNVKSIPSPTLQMINDEIQKIQAAKERLGEIYMNVERNFYLKRRAVDILECAWYKYTNEKSADKRKGDAVIRISRFSADLAKTESCYKVCQHIIKNLDDGHESLSRQITVNQLLLKMNDYGRGGGLPEYDVNSRRRSRREEEDTFSKPKSDTDGKKDELAEEEF